ncbi:MAG: hypothetical protein WCD80_15890 [Desulfobaccales bacterium]
MGRFERIIIVVCAIVGSLICAPISAYIAVAIYWRESQMIPPDTGITITPPIVSHWPSMGWGVLALAFWAGSAVLILYGAKKGVWRRKRTRKFIENDLDIRSVGNTAIEPYLQWLHLEVEPAASLKVARDARVTLKVELDQRIKERPEPTVYSMRWASDEGPKEERTLRYGQPGSIPLVLRSSIDVGISGYGEAPHTLVKRDICYITDDQFLIHQNPIHRLPEAGKHKLTISVFYGDHNESVSKVYELGVHHPVSGSNLIYIISEKEKL